MCIRDSAYVDEEISIGDYVLTGGELASMVIADAVTRLVPGVITEESHLDESFENGLLEYPQYTRPVDYEGHTVPEVLLSGHHENIRKFRLKESLRLTLQVRPDLLENPVSYTHLPKPWYPVIRLFRWMSPSARSAWRISLRR